MVLRNFWLELVLCIIIGGTYNLPAASGGGTYVAVSYSLGSALSPCVLIYAVYRIPNTDMLHAQLLAYRARHQGQVPNQLPGNSPGTAALPSPDPVTSVVLQTTMEEPIARTRV